MPRTATKLPTDAQPMLCSLVDAPFDNPQWLFEPKLDGLRVLVHYNGSEINLISRNNKSQNLQFPDILNGLRKALSKTIMLDGEIVCLDENGQSTFRKLQQRFHVMDPAEIASRAEQFPAYLFVFDAIFADGRDIRRESLSTRKRLLRKSVRWNQRIRFTPGTRGKGIEMLEDACRHGAEGIVAKRMDSYYVAERSGDWLKIKCSGRQEFVIGGYTDPQRTRVGLGALLVGYYSDDGNRFVYAGKVGTGFTNDVLLDLRQRLNKLAIKNNPFDSGKPPHGEHVHWVQPRLVGEIAYAEWTQNDLLRQPRFEGLRPDKNAAAVHREKAQHLNKQRIASGKKAGSQRNGA